MTKRCLTKKEIESLLEFIQPQRGIPQETALSIVNINKVRFRNQLEGQEIYPELIPKLREELEVIFRSSQVQAGESVGVICAQSFGERATQKCLNTFHKAGISEKVMTQGTPRFAEIINATKKPRNVGQFIYLRKKASNVAELRNMVGSSFVGLTLKDISTKITVKLNAEPETWYELFKTYHNDEFSHHAHCVSFQLNVDKLFEIKLSMEKMAESIETEYGDLFCVFSPPQLGRFDIFVDVSNISLPEDRILFIEADNAEEVFLEELVLPQLEQLNICGIPGITEIFFAQANGEWFVDTQGINSRTIKTSKTNYLNYKTLLACPIVDPHRTISNNVWDIYEVLGIEAARRFLIEELLDIVDGVNPCHTRLLVDRMTHGGSISSITRYTMRREDAGVFSKCSFEETMDHLLDAAARGELEPTKGISASIVTGKASKIGTGMAKLRLDLQSLPACKPKRKPRRKLQPVTRSKMIQEETDIGFQIIPQKEEEGIPVFVQI